MKCNLVVLGCALVWGLSGWGAVPAKPASPPKGAPPKGAPAFPWRKIEAETYTVRDKASGQMMRGIRVFILAPDYRLFVRDGAPAVSGPRAQWRLSDGLGRSYIKGPARVRVVGDQTRGSQKVHVMEMVCGYVAVPASRTGRLQLSFPFDLRKVANPKYVVNANGVVKVTAGKGA